MLSDTMNRPPLDVAIAAYGLSRLATELGVTYQAIRKWQARGRLPRTEWTGETHYAELIEALMTGAVTKPQLLAAWPPPMTESAL